MVSFCLYDLKLPVSLFCKVVDAFSKSGFTLHKIKPSEGEPIFYGVGADGEITLENGDLSIEPDFEYLDDTINIVLKYRELLHDIDPRFEVYSDINGFATGYIDPSLYNSVVCGFRVRYAYDKYKNGRRKKYAAVFLSLKYVGDVLDAYQ